MRSPRSRVLARRPAFAASVLLAGFLVAACTGGGSTVSIDRRGSRVGGTLELSMVRGDFHPGYPGDPFVNLDPARDDTRTGMELLRCCLARTLLAPDNRPGRGGDLSPDLAVSVPAVSQDGLTWTFRLRLGLRYAPPLQDVPIVAADIKRALTRVADLGPDAAYPSAFSPIEGFDEAVRGAPSITGLETPDDRTLRVRLLAPTADLGYRLALPAAAPIPPGPKGTARFGVATGHDSDYGAYLVSSGPYMYEGSDLESFNDVAGPPVVDLGGGTDLTLVRNPSWDPAVDPLRPAYVDRIQISTGAGSPAQDAELVDQGRSDFQFEERSTASASTFDQYQADADRRGHAFAWALDDTWYIAMNVAVPPFDDPAVRRAVALAFNSQGAVDSIRHHGSTTDGWYDNGSPTVHIAPDDTEANRLAGFDPFRGKKGLDRRARARGALTESSYATDRVGNCIDPVCDGMVIAAFGQSPFPAIAESVKKDLTAIGIKAQVEPLTAGTSVPRGFDPSAPVGLIVGPPVATDYPSASLSFLPLTSAMISSESARNFSMVGATPAQLKGLGYPVMHVPSIDGRLDFCRPVAAAEQVSCWVLLDKYLMKDLVPWVPYFTSTLVWVDTQRVRGVVQDPFSKMPSLDQVWLSQATEEPSSS